MAANETKARREGGGLALLVTSAAGVKVVPLADRGTWLVGRGARCDVVVDDESVSREHARLTLEPLTIEDLGSRNGTTVGGNVARPGEPVALASGSVVEIGSAILLIHPASLLIPEGAESPPVSGPLADHRAAGPAAPAHPAAAAAQGHAPSSAGPGSAGAFAHGAGPALAGLGNRTVPPPADTDPSLGRDGLTPIVVDPALARVYDQLDAIAPSPIHVLVLGETGVGKDVYARVLHQRSDRHERPFVEINCAALPETLLEAELFGHEKGAFTGALRTKPGLFEAANGGTVFLDEVGELTPATQAKLLRVLESGQVMRLGSVRPLTVDVRVVAATNRNLRKAVDEGAFRADLYFRLNGATVTIPPLRERRGDLAPLARHFLDRMRTRLGRPPIAISELAMRAMERHAWPGNVRELRNLMERAAVIVRGADLTFEQLAMVDPETFAAQATASAAPSAHDLSPRVPLGPADVTRETEAPSLRDQLRQVERQRIVDALQQTAGNQSQAARILGMSRYTLMNRMEEYGLARPRKKPS